MSVCRSGTPQRPRCCPLLADWMGRLLFAPPAFFRCQACFQVPATALQDPHLGVHTRSSPCFQCSGQQTETTQPNISRGGFESTGDEGPINSLAGLDLLHAETLDVPEYDTVQLGRFNIFHLNNWILSSKTIEVLKDVSHLTWPRGWGNHH